MNPRDSVAANPRTTAQLRLALLGMACAGLLAVGLFVAGNALQARQLADKQWSDLRVRNALRVGIDPGWQPFSFYAADGWQGLDADLTREIARRMNLPVQTNPVGYDSMYDALHLWQVDMVISAVPIDPSRRGDYAYTAAYFDAGVRLLALRASAVHSIDDLSGRRVAVALGSEADRAARYWERRLVNVTRRGVADDEIALKSLLSGEVDAAIVEALTAARVAGADGALSNISIAPQPYAIVVRGDNPLLLAELNRLLADMRADGMLDRLIARWTRGN